jgi:hypothetical protein
VLALAPACLCCLMFLLGKSFLHMAGVSGKWQNRLDTKTVTESISVALTITQQVSAPMMDFIEFKNAMAYKRDWDRKESWRQWCILYQDQNIKKDMKGHAPSVGPITPRANKNEHA